MPAPTSWKNVDPQIIDLIHGQAEKHLSAQLTAGVAADQRAASAATVFIGFAGAIIAAALGYWAVKPDAAILASGVAAGIGMLSGAAMCLYAARPVDFYFAGNQPEKWYDCLDVPVAEAKGLEAEHYQEMISANASVLANNNAWLKAGYICASVSPALAAAMYFLVIFLSSCQGPVS